MKKTKREKEDLPEAEEEEISEAGEASVDEEVSEEGESGSESETPKEKKEVSKLFGDTKLSSGGLFGNLSSGSTEDKPKLFANAGSSNLFANSSLFSGSSSSLFSGGSNSLFGAKPLFNFSSVGATGGFLNKKEEEEKSDEEGGEGDNDLFQSDSPNPYNASDKQPVAAEKSVYSKKYNKEVESIYIFVKEDNKFVSKGKGFLSLESAEIDGKKVAVVVFR
jgi:hypothetical protein